MTNTTKDNQKSFSTLFVNKINYIVSFKYMVIYIVYRGVRIEWR